MSFGNPRGTFLIRESETTKGRLAKAILTTNEKVYEKNCAKFMKYCFQWYEGSVILHICARELEVWTSQISEECSKHRTTQGQPMPGSTHGICSASHAEAGCSALLSRSERCTVSLLGILLLQWSQVESVPSGQQLWGYRRQTSWCPCPGPGTAS